MGDFHEDSFVLVPHIQIKCGTTMHRTHHVQSVVCCCFGDDPSCLSLVFLFSVSWDFRCCWAGLLLLQYLPVGHGCNCFLFRIQQQQTRLHFFSSFVWRAIPFSGDIRPRTGECWMGSTYYRTAAAVECEKGLFNCFNGSSGLSPAIHNSTRQVVRKVLASLLHQAV